MNIDFETWKAEYEPQIYEDSGAECYDHDECECEFLYTYEPSEILDDEELAPLVKQHRVWTWRSDGSIVNGIAGSDLLVTAKPWTEEMEVN